MEQRLFDERAKEERSVSSAWSREKWFPALPYAYNLSVGAAAPLDMLKLGGATPRTKLTSPTIPNWI